MNAVRFEARSLCSSGHLNGKSLPGEKRKSYVLHHVWGQLSREELGCNCSEFRDKNYCLSLSKAYIKVTLRLSRQS